MDKMTTISTTYARICILLLAVNFVLTGYAINSLVKLQNVDEQTSPVVNTQSTDTTTQEE